MINAPDSPIKYEHYWFSLCALVIALILALSLLGIGLSMEGVPTFLYLQEHKQLIEDWTTKPYVDVKVVEST